MNNEYILIICIITIIIYIQPYLNISNFYNSKTFNNPKTFYNSKTLKNYENYEFENINDTIANIPINKKNIPIYCLMITGKDDYCYQFAKIAIENFMLQTFVINI